MKILIFAFLMCGFLSAQTIKTIGDTTDMKNLKWRQPIILLQFGGGTFDDTGGGIFIPIDSTLSEGTHAFDHPESGKQWARLGYVGGELSAFQDITGTTLVTTSTITVGTAGSGADVQFFSATSGDHFLWDASEEALTIIGTAAQDALNVDDGNVDIADDLDVDGTTNLDDVDIDLSAALNIDGHMVDIGAGSYATADGDNDLGVAGVVEIVGALELDGGFAYVI